MNYIVLKDDDVIEMDERTGDIVVDIDKLGTALNVGDTVEIHYEEDAPHIIHVYTVKQTDEYNNVIALKWVEQTERALEEALLVEEPVIKLDDADLVDPKQVNFRDKIQKGLEQERAEAEAAAKEKRSAELRAKYSDLLDKVDTISDTTDAIEALFEQLVPSSGPAETVAGEFVRAIMRILFRDYNDRDKFFEGYGLETCGGSAEYLFDHGFEEEIESILNNAYQLADDDDKYTKEITKLAQAVVDRIKSEPELLETENKEDSRDYSYEYIEEKQPRYEYEIPGSDDVVTLVEKEILTSWDLIDYVSDMLSYERVYEGADVGRPWGHHDTSVTVENLTKEGVEYLEEAIKNNLNGWWEDLVSEHADELEDDYDDDEDYDEETDEE